MSTRFLLLAVVALAGCGSSSPDRRTDTPPPVIRTTPVPPGDDEQILALLERRARLLEDGSPSAYARTSAGARRARDRQAARNARGLGLRDVSFEASSVQVAGDAATVRTRLTYRVRGLRGEFGGERTLTVVRRGPGWRVSARDGRRGLDPWEAGDFDRTRSRHFVVWAPPTIDVAAGGLLAALEDGYERIRGLLAKGRLDPRYLVVVAADPRQARQVTSSIRGLDGLTAVTDTEVFEEGPAQHVSSVRSQRLVVVWSSFAAIDAEARRTVITHELTHAALAPATSGRTPAWLTEGMALWVSADRRALEAAELLDSLVATNASGRRRAALSLRSLAAPDAIADTAGGDQAAAYAFASSAAHFIAERYGRRRLLALYDAFNDPRLRGRPGDPALVDKAVRRVLAFGTRRLERELREWLSAQAVGGVVAP